MQVLLAFYSAFTMHSTVSTYGMAISLSVCVLFGPVRGEHAVSLAVSVKTLQSIATLYMTWAREVCLYC